MESTYARIQGTGPALYRNERFRDAPAGILQLERLESRAPLRVGQPQQTVPVEPQQVEEHVGDRGALRLTSDSRLAAQVHAPPALFDCCVDLDRESVDTRSNATQTADWIAAHHYRSVRLVTTDWHMPRARFEMARLLRPRNVAILADAVPSEPGFEALFGEYNKYLIRRLAVWADL